MSSLSHNVHNPYSAYSVKSLDHMYCFVVQCNENIVGYPIIFSVYDSSRRKIKFRELSTGSICLCLPQGDLVCNASMVLETAGMQILEVFADDIQVYSRCSTGDLSIVLIKTLPKIPFYLADISIAHFDFEL
jgi:hypothetical protein